MVKSGAPDRGKNWKVAQHGIGFVGQAWTRAFDERCRDGVIGLDIDQAKIDELRRFGVAACHVNEVDAYRGVDIHSFSVPTPSIADTDNPFVAAYDLSYLNKALESFGRDVIRSSLDWKLVVIRSTLQPGTTRKVLIPILEQASGKKVGRGFDVVYYPEFLREKNAMGDALKQPFISYAATGDRAAGVFEETFGCLKPAGFEGQFFVQHNRLELAELHKLINNHLNGHHIAFFSWWTALTVEGIMAGSPPTHDDLTRLYAAVVKTAFAKVEPAYGTNHKMGAFGGSCLPKDIRAVAHLAEEHGMPQNIAETILQVNGHFADRHGGIMSALSAGRDAHAEPVPEQAARETPSDRIFSRVGSGYGDASSSRLQGRTEESRVGKDHDGHEHPISPSHTTHHNGDSHLVSTGGGARQNDVHRNGVGDDGKFGRRSG